MRERERERGRVRVCPRAREGIFLRMRQRPNLLIRIIVTLAVKLAGQIAYWKIKYKYKMRQRNIVEYK